MCRMFSCTPSQLDKEDAGIVRLVGIVARGTKKEVEDDGTSSGDGYGA